MGRGGVCICCAPGPVILGGGCVGAEADERCAVAGTIPISSRRKPHLLQKCASFGNSALHLGQRNIHTTLL